MSCAQVQVILNDWVSQVSIVSYTIITVARNGFGGFAGDSGPAVKAP